MKMKTSKKSQSPRPMRTKIRMASLQPAKNQETNPAEHREQRLDDRRRLGPASLGYSHCCPSMTLTTERKKMKSCGSTQAGDLFAA